jgi:hypothetical protein
MHAIFALDEHLEGVAHKGGVDELMQTVSVRAPTAGIPCRDFLEQILSALQKEL